MMAVRLGYFAAGWYGMAALFIAEQGDGWTGAVSAAFSVFLASFAFVLERQELRR